MSWSYKSRKSIRELLGVVAVNSDVSSSDFHTDKLLVEDDTEAQVLPFPLLMPPQAALWLTGKSPR